MYQYFQDFHEGASGLFMSKTVAASDSITCNTVDEPRSFGNTPEPTWFQWAVCHVLLLADAVFAMTDSYIRGMPEGLSTDGDEERVHEE